MVTEEQSRMLDIVARFQPGVRQRFELRSKLDPAFAHAYLRYASRLLSRPTLDARTRLLVMTGQFTMGRRHARLRETFVAAIAAKINLREVLEVVFQCAIYGGESITDEPLTIFTEELSRAGLLEQISEQGLQPGKSSKPRDPVEERSRWHPEDAADSVPSHGHARLMQALDRIEQRHGRGAVHLASASLKRAVPPVWQMKQGRRTPGYTTEWSDLAIARA